jgi:hypothetical protein
LDGWLFARYFPLIPVDSQRRAGSVLTPGAGPVAANYPVVVTAGNDREGEPGIGKGGDGIWMLMTATAHGTFVDGRPSCAERPP